MDLPTQLIDEADGEYLSQVVVLTYPEPWGLPSSVPIPGDGAKAYYGSARPSTYQDIPALIVSKGSGEDGSTIILNHRGKKSIPIQGHSRARPAVKLLECSLSSIKKIYNVLALT